MNFYSLLSTSLLLGLSPASHASEPPSVDTLNWLAGCWASVGGEAGSGELWTVPAGNTLFGIGRTVKNGKTVAYEYMQIRSNEDGGIEFIANPSGQTGATFVMQSLTADEVVFENLAHDFPQRVIYRLEAADELTGRIEGQVNGEARSVDFPLKRVDCRASTTSPISQIN